MKTSKILGTTLLTLLMAVVAIAIVSRKTDESGVPRGYAAAVVSPTPVKEVSRKFVDPQGKPITLKKGEKYLAEQVLADGTVRVYRRNKEDIARLIDAFKDTEMPSGFLNTAESWNRSVCMMLPTGPCYGNCGNRVCKRQRLTAARGGTNPAGDVIVPIEYCACG